MAARIVTDEHVITLIRVNNENDQLKEIWNSIKLLKKSYLFVASQMKKHKRATTGRKSRIWTPKVQGSGSGIPTTSNDVVSSPSVPPGLISRSHISDNPAWKDVSASKTDKDKKLKADKAAPPPSTTNSTSLKKGFFNKPDASLPSKPWPFLLKPNSTVEPFNMALFEKGDTPESSDDEYTSTVSRTRRGEDGTKDKPKDEDKDKSQVKDKEKKEKVEEKKNKEEEKKMIEDKIKKKPNEVKKKSKEVLKLEEGAYYLDKYTRK